ncbi:cilia- and flagella-associated protein 91-like [Argiope bruennichi]|uniref:cilia- and flagella-associated protein 91-like n=1 Tax=Argiope bruennichi TaxID=94029 RepID=UPI002494C7AE|nr:cilia- and flagella-associated protein 91-like [Argiope bruennichi]XP_055939594.1 cilia- and flagella-associated protein 91-like [Argiope bruennichi]
MNRTHSSKKNNCVISGADLCKFYNRPIEITSKVGDIVEEEKEISFVRCDTDISVVDKFISKGTQTDYRENETQTDPWDPPSKITKIREEPEVLSIQNLTFGSGLPASLLEVNYISELRKNRKLKAEAESSEDDEAFKRKKQITCSQVRNDWNYKISILNEKQYEKYNALKSSLIDEMKRHSDRKEKFLTTLWNHKMAEMNKQNCKLQQKLRKEINVLESGILSKESDILGTGDIHERFSVKSTKAKATISKGTEYMLSNYYLTDPAGLSSVKSWLDTKTDGLKTEIPLSKVFKRSQKERLAEQAYLNILEKKRSKLPPKIYREDYVKEELPAPTVKAEDVIEFFDFEEKKVDLVTVWQKALRGLARQKQMLELIECHKESLSTVLSPLYPGIAES